MFPFVTGHTFLLASINNIFACDFIVVLCFSRRYLRHFDLSWGSPLQFTHFALFGHLTFSPWLFSGHMAHGVVGFTENTIVAILLTSEKSKWA